MIRESNMIPYHDGLCIVSLSRYPRIISSSVHTYIVHRKEEEFLKCFLFLFLSFFNFHSSTQLTLTHSHKKDEKDPWKIGMDDLRISYRIVSNTIRSKQVR
jgi:hypothetical protein